MLITICILVIFWGMRFLYLNINTNRPEIEIYQQGEFVEYGDNFFYRSSSEQRNGYSIKVVDAKLMRMEDYLKNIGLSYSDYLKMIEDSSGFEKEYVVDVQIIIKNTNNTVGNFDRLDTRIHGINFCLSCEDILFDYMYPNLKDSYGFKVRENTEYKINIPYCPEAVDIKTCNEKYLMGNNLYLNISQYPVKKMIKLQVETFQ